MEFWERSFVDKQAMWGYEPSSSAINSLELFRQNNLKNILIPGFGYGRNAKIFADNGFHITGIEISETAIEIAKQFYGSSLNVYHGSVNDMPFDYNLYDGIFCYALIHLLNRIERKKLIENCYLQLSENGYMIFVALAIESPNFGTGKELSQNRFKSNHGVNLFFYDLAAIKKEFGKYGFVDAKLVNESSMIFWQITCKKSNKV